MLSGPSFIADAAMAEPDAQQRKLDFLARPDAAGIYNPYAEQRPVSPNQIMAGSVIAAALVTGLNSDLPGTVVAQVTENIHDSVTGQILLIPQGSRLIGTYDSRVSFGQERALLVWQRLIRPDGSSLQLDNLPASDTEGQSGLADRVNFHTGRLLKGIVLATLLGVGTELTFGQQESELVRAVRESMQQNADRAGQRLVERNLDIQPTLTVRPGWPLRIIVWRDVILSPYRGG
ncbi:TrbI/VirB10 family protein [Niveispirillum fermenti]|uniref:TrbI/VirB10 family protein n=1 Tax=Niveispirillum fermenti TaxID=1233113 RepID=UPI003A84083C